MGNSGLCQHIAHDRGQDCPTTGPPPQRGVPYSLANLRDSEVRKHPQDLPGLVWNESGSLWGHREGLRRVSRASHEDPRGLRSCVLQERIGSYRECLVAGDPRIPVGPSFPACNHPPPYARAPHQSPPPHLNPLHQGSSGEWIVKLKDLPGTDTEQTPHSQEKDRPPPYPPAPIPNLALHSFAMFVALSSRW